MPEPREKQEVNDLSAMSLKKACHRFAEAAGPYLHLTDERHYEEALELVEALMQEARDSANDPLNAIIEIIARAIDDYERRDDGLAEFERQASSCPSDIAVVRLIMNQHGLGVADLPEIGSKSMVSRVLSRQRDLGKRHIKALAERFGIDPALFF